jgi:protoheme IX farnesyltransferase
VNDLFSLIRIKVSLSIIISTTLGFVYGSVFFNKTYILVIVAVFFISTGCSVLNQIQEAKIDKLMERTKNRPVAKGKLSKFKAFILAITCILFSFIIFLNINIKVFILGLLTIIIYNFLYTPLKLKTSYSILVGAFIGSIPPLMGFFASNHLFNDTIINISIIYYLWQIPHFWLITELYKNDYKCIIYPFLNDRINERQYKIIFIVWIVSYILAILHLLLIDSVYYNAVRLCIFAIVLLILIIYLVKLNNIKKLFFYHNMLLGAITILLITDRIISQNF